MNEYALAVLEIGRHAITERVTTSRCLSSRPCWLINVIVEPGNAGAESYVTVRNGETAAADILIGFRGQYSHPTHNGPFPVYFNRGLYIELNKNADAAFVQYLIESV